jgi:aspartyl-tRNA(Asn)/glutamyl-tRNA(Gln) amidotransferase subunit A
VTSLAGAGPFAGISLAELGARLRSGGSALDLVEAALAAAEELGATLNCFVTLDHDGARRAAEQADRELAAGLDRGPLHGLPVGVKDLIDTAGLRTTYGSAHFAEHRPVRDAAVVTALRQAGAVIVGKTHTHEFAYGPTGDVAHTGPARNPHDPDRMTGGSSSGSAAAVAAGIVPLALGTDTGGSTRIPAALCGITGFRPSPGVLSTAGVFPLSTTLDTPGPMAATPADTALAQAVLTDAALGSAGLTVDRRTGAIPSPATLTGLANETSADRPGVGGAPSSTEPAGFTGEVPPAGGVLTGLRIGVLRPDAVSSQLAAVDRAVMALRTAGSALTEIDAHAADEARTLYQPIQGPEAAAIHRRLLAQAPERYQPTVLARLRDATGVPGWEYVTALAERQRLRAAPPWSVDVLLLPTVPIEAPPIGARHTDLGAGWTDPVAALLSLTTPWSVLGCPAVSLPVLGAGLPASVQLVGRPGADAALLATAAALATLL